MLYSFTLRKPGQGQSQELRGGELRNDPPCLILPYCGSGPFLQSFLVPIDHDCCHLLLELWAPFCDQTSNYGYRITLVPLGAASHIWCIPQFPFQTDFSPLLHTHATFLTLFHSNLKSELNR